MSANEKEFAGYVAIKEGGSFFKGTYRLAGERKRLSELIAPSDENTEIDPIPNETDRDSVEHEALEEILDRASGAAQSLHSLVFTIQVSRAIHTGILRQFEIIDAAQKHGEKLSEENDYVIYGLDGAWFSNLLNASASLNKTHRGYELLPSSVFLSIISVFDSLMVEFVEKMLRLKPQRLESSSKEIEVSKVLKFSDMDSFWEHIIDEEIFSFSKGSHEEQVKYIEKAFNVSIIKFWKRWPDFIEVFERRNLVAHGVKTFNKRYAERCASAGHKGSDEQIGKEVELRHNYLIQALNILFEFYGLLIFSVWKKIFPIKEPEAFSAANQFCFDLISNEIYDAPTQILTYLTDLEKSNVDKRTYLMLLVNLASAHKHNDKNDEAQSVLDKENWGAYSEDFQICVAALKEDIDTVCKKIPIVVSSSDFDKDAFRTWPVFSFIRYDKKFRRAFVEQFGEDIIDPKEPVEDQSKAEEGSGENLALPDGASDETDAPTSDAETIH
ncbi:hypothetical protein AAG607_13395 [Citromicrobium bathyomarinum]|uniref:hypothetical protein n=1 Tax=Sphingomonadales TaxID=204457 RepID=UPI000C489DA0|nr:hypothetical protein [Citromicrobium sp.]|tara:strand:+ start:213 stop:1706 length:1494 start_codon:yes stop_codon:yes gene_type:complete